MEDYQSINESDGIKGLKMMHQSPCCAFAQHELTSCSPAARGLAPITISRSRGSSSSLTKAARGADPFVIGLIS